MIVYYAWCAGCLPLLLGLAVALMKRPTFPPSGGRPPRPNIPKRKQTSEVKP